MQDEESVIYTYRFSYDDVLAAVCFFTTIHFKEALQPAEWKAAEILLLGDFLQRKEGKVLREIGSNSILCKVHIVQKIQTAKNSVVAHHTRGSCVAAGSELKGVRAFSPSFV